MLLADLGAEVLKVEEPEQGDYYRWYTPYINGVGTRHLVLNRNKQSITLNLKKPEGKEIFLKLVREGADVLIEQFRPGVMDRLGLGYKELEKVNPRLIYCSLTGYGQDGPYRDLAGHDINYIALGGILGMTGIQGGPPAIPGVQIGDLVGGGLYAVIGILTALLAREKTERGQYIDVSMMDGIVSLLPDGAAIFFAEGKSPGPGERRLTGGLPQYQVYQTRDGKYLAGAAVEYEPDEEVLLAALLPRYLQTQIFGALLEIAASEQGASMTAMDNATRNAGDLINRLTILYNRSRQAAITTELIEIISGAEAL